MCEMFKCLNVVYFYFSLVCVMRIVDGYPVNHKNLTLVVFWCGNSNNAVASESSSGTHCDGHDMSV